MAAVVVLALQIYLWIAPAPSAQNGFSLVFRSIISWFAYGCAFLFVLGAFFSFLTQLIRGRRFKATQSIADIRSLSWRQFESYIGEMFRQDGYFVVETPEGPDNGVDLVLRKEGEKTYVQCKHWKANTVGVEKIRELLGSMAAGGAQAGIFVTTGDYTQPAKDFARDCGIKIIDGEQLAWFLGKAQGELQHPGQGSDESAVSCPICGATMVKRVAKRGKNKGNTFWGCSRYPDCRGIRNA